MQDQSQLSENLMLLLLLKAPPGNPTEIFLPDPGFQTRNQCMEKKFAFSNFLAFQVLFISLKNARAVGRGFVSH